MRMMSDVYSAVVNNGPGPVSPWSLYTSPLLWPTKYWNSYNRTTITWCHKNSWIYLTSTYYWWLLRSMITIRFDSKFRMIAQLFDSIQNEKNTIRTALVSAHSYSVLMMGPVCIFVDHTLIRCVGSCRPVKRQAFLTRVKAGRVHLCLWSVIAYGKWRPVSSEVCTQRVIAL